MGLAFVAEEAVAWDYFLQGFHAVLDLEDGTLAAEDEDHLTVSFMLMHSDRCTRDECTFENAVGSVKEHMSGKLLFAAFEVWQHSVI